MGWSLIGATVFLGLQLTAQAVPTVQLDGSSTVYPISEAVAEEFQLAHKSRILVTVGVSGTGGGFKKFCRGDIHISGASRPIKEKERKLCKQNGIRYIEIPVAFDALTVVVNQKNHFAKKLTVEQLKKIWEPSAQRKVNSWRDVSQKFPGKRLRLYGPGADSGTFDYFTEVIVGKSGASRGDYTASEDDNVLVQGVLRSRGGLGYFGYAYYAENKDKISAVAIQNAQGDFVLPSQKTVMDGSYNPLSRPIFIYISSDSLKEPSVRKFLDFYLDSATELVEEVQYVPLSEDIYQLARENIKNRRYGTAYSERSTAGVSLTESLTGELVE